MLEDRPGGVEPSQSGPGGHPEQAGCHLLTVLRGLRLPSRGQRRNQHLRRNPALSREHLNSQPPAPACSQDPKPRSGNTCRISPLASFQTHAGCGQGLEQGQVTGSIPNGGSKQNLSLAFQGLLPLTQRPPYSGTAACSHHLDDWLPGTRATLQQLFPGPH